MAWRKTKEEVKEDLRVDGISEENAEERVR